MERKWPQQIWIARHGQSAGNVARARRTPWATGSPPFPLNNNRPSCCIRPTCGRSRRRKPCCRVSTRTALPRWRPTSACAPRPPHRARHRRQVPGTARTAPARGPVLLPPTGRRKLVRRHPAPAQRARHHHPRIPGRTGADRRPPGHRQLLPLPAGTLRRADHPGIDKAADVPNCGITSYAFNPALGRHGKLQLDLCNFVAPLEAAGTPVTAQPDMPAAPKS